MSQNIHLDMLGKPAPTANQNNNTTTTTNNNNNNINVQRQQQQPSNMSTGPNSNHQTFSADQRHAALASLFSSLSSLANGTSSHQPPQAGAHLPRGFMEALSAPLQQSAAVARDAIPKTGSECPLALTSSIQSVVAAAMVQRQLAASAALKQQPELSQQIPPVPTTTTISFADQQMGPSFTFATRPFKQELALGVGGLNQFGGHQVAQHQQQPQQRINYCTICNKELCNKYFMKTHMLKMHGINLEMEQPDDDSGNNNQSDGRDNGDDDTSSDSNSWSQIKESGDDKSPQDMTQAKLKRQQDKKSASSGPNKQQATSVLNGFAGNSMGGVVCDICNKELCSKYFLKVHKQNTHGIVTDYQDASQFLYPFHPAGPAQAAPAPPMANPFLTAAAAAAAVAIPTSSATNPLAFLRQHQQQQQQPPESKKSAKRARLMTNTDHQSSANCIESKVPPGNPFPSGQSAASDEDLDSLYRLMIGQQQSQFAGGPHVLSMDAHHVAANPISALMCFGALSPFGAASVSPTMIVDYILRNQHLFNKNSLLNSLNNSSSDTTKPNQTSSGKKASKGGSKSNPNSDKSKGGANNKSPADKDSQTSNQANNNNKYLSHYTEACPMCDRRFKSIKWLKTHMMNDHKQEIATCMQMMMQHLYASNATVASQQAAAVASMASAFEQQQQTRSSFPTLVPPASQQNFQPQNATGTFLSQCLGAGSGRSSHSSSLFLQQQQQQQHQQQHLQFNKTGSIQQFYSSTDQQPGQNERSCPNVEANSIRSFNSIKFGQHSPIRAAENSVPAVLGHSNNSASTTQLIGSSSSSVSEFGDQQEMNERIEDQDEELDLSLNFSMDTKCNGVVNLSNDTSDEFLLAGGDINDDESIIVQDSDDNEQSNDNTDHCPDLDTASNSSNK